MNPNPLGLTILALLAALLFPAGPASAQENFLARFESDAAGTWLVYPTAPGWHYTVQYTTDMALDPENGDPAFTNEPDGYGYGTGGDLRYFIAPPPPPANSGPPPEKPLRVFSATIRNSLTPGDTRVQVSGTGSDDTPWSIIAPGTLPRDGGAVTITTETPTEIHRLQILVLSLPGLHLTATAGPASLTPAQRPLYDMVEAHWNDIIATLNLPHSPAEEPDPGPPGAPPRRRFLRVVKQATDSNTNGIPDWWELQYGYTPFAITGESGYLGQSTLTDTDGDGLSNYIEGRCGLNPNSPDSDSDGLPDILEDSDTDGAINQSELLNRSQLWNPDTDDDGLPDGDDWVELIDGEFTFVTRETPYDFLEPLAALPDTAARSAFRGTLDGTLPAYNNEWLPPVEIELAEGEMLLAHRTYEIADEDDYWLETARLKRARYRFRTGAASAISGEVPAPVYFIKRTTVSSTAFGTSTDFEVVSVPIASGDTVSEISAASFPANYPPYEEDLELHLAEFGASDYAEVTTVTKLTKWLQVDANMDGQVTDADDDHDLVPGDNHRLAETTRCLILDINNNNSDAGNAASPTDEIHDHVSPDLDGAADALEIVKTNSATAPGHLCGHAKVTMLRKFVEEGLRGTQPSADHYLWIHRTGDACVRVHLDEGQPDAFGPFKKRVLGIPGDLGANDQLDTRTGEELRPAIFPDTQEKFSEIPLLLEGVSAGTCELHVELRKYLGANIADEIIGTLKIRILVNVDQLPDADLNKPRAQGLMGTNPHYVGFNFGDILPANTAEGSGVIALRGRLQAEFPAARQGIGWKPMLTHRHSKLRLFDQAQEEETVGTASFWFGLNSRFVHISGEQGLDDADARCWVQAGLVLSQGHADPFPNTSSPPGVRMYLESGRLGYQSQHQQKFATEATHAGAAFTATGALRAWEARGISLDFVLFQIRGESATYRDPWFLVCHDVRAPGSELYFRLQAGPPDPNGETPQIYDTITQIHKRAVYSEPEFETELTNSAGLLFGNASHPAVIERMEFALTKDGDDPPVGGSTSAEATFTAASGNGPNDSRYDWQALHPGPPADPGGPARNVSIRRRTGRVLLNGTSVDDLPPAQGDTVHLDFWHLIREPVLVGQPPNQISLERFRFEDERSWGFPDARR